MEAIGQREGELDQWKKRSHWAAALPRLQAGFTRQLRDVISLTTSDNVSVTGGDVFVGPAENDFDQSVNQASAFEVKALWYFSDLIFNRDELSVSHERREWLHETQKILREVTQSYLTWQRLKKNHRSEKNKILFDQSRAVLDAHTRGWFSREIGEK